MQKLRCPETLFISHENANFLFQSLGWFKVRPNTKHNGVLQGKFCILPALKIGTFRGKWTLEWAFKTSLFARLALYFFNQQLTCFFFACFSTMPSGDCKRTFDFEWRTVQKITFCLYVWKPVQPENFSFSVPFSIIREVLQTEFRFRFRKDPPQISAGPGWSTPEEVEPNFLFCKSNFLFRFGSINGKKCVVLATRCIVISKNTTVRLNLCLHSTITHGISWPIAITNREAR